MAIPLWFRSFRSEGVQDEDGTEWNDGTVTAGSPFAGSPKAMAMTWNNQQGIRLSDDEFTPQGTNVNLATDAVFMAVRWHQANAAAQANWLASFGWREIAFPNDGYFWNLWLEADGSLILYAANNIIDAGGGAITVCTAPAGTLQREATYYIEFGGYFDDTTGWGAIRINGSVVASAEGLDTAEIAETERGVPDSLQSLLNGTVAASTTWFQDHSIWAATDAGLASADWPGEHKSELRVPNGDSTVQFTRSAGTTNAENVDEDPASDADYNESNTVGHKDLLTLEDLVDTGDPACVRVITRAAKNGAGARTLRTVVSSNATERDGPVRTLGDGTFQSWVDIHRDDPDAGGSAFTNAKFDAWLIGYKVDS